MVFEGPCGLKQRQQQSTVKDVFCSGMQMIDAHAAQLTAAPLFLLSLWPWTASAPVALPAYADRFGISNQAPECYAGSA